MLEEVDNECQCSSFGWLALVAIVIVQFCGSIQLSPRPRHARLRLAASTPLLVPLSERDFQSWQSDLGPIGSSGGSAASRTEPVRLDAGP